MLKMKRQQKSNNRDGSNYSKILSWEIEQVEPFPLFDFCKKIIKNSVKYNSITNWKYKNMEKNVEISVLCQLYGKALTEKQYEVLTDYYNNDLSLSEIAENNNITRQAVRDIIKKGENKLYELEENISLMKKVLEEEKIVTKIISELNEIERLTNSDKEIEKRINNIEKELKKIN